MKAKILKEFNMSKFRRLSAEELSIFENEFINFLVVNGVDANEWEKIKKDNVEKADKMVDIFSDFVFEKVINETEFLMFRSPKYIQCVHCQPNQMFMVAISSINEDYDLTQYQITALDMSKVEFYKGEKKYQQDRTAELFEMMNKGFQKTDGTLYKQLLMISVSE
ncbi:DUF6495 family protein [Paracrocinitomix mangrovi]|uniref:DUF6495 family protein n=1 Tax=Paracrocinitomix mangrovi TaxID=2862509 RepID=UPI001C8E4E06|nr:DUF6495 family protein [Paracrocinitomix mangrovi]UKN02413.1 DUF6495 family protein [Paracrocinitomix mangrovi]